jgi:hypothetical protein
MMFETYKGETMTRRLLAALALAAGAAGAQGVTDTTVLLGQSVALTGPAQQLGLDMQLGARSC